MTLQAEAAADNTAWEKSWVPHRALEVPAAVAEHPKLAVLFPIP